jgi:protein SCO1/2
MQTDGRQQNKKWAVGSGQCAARNGRRLLRLLATGHGPLVTVLVLLLTAHCSLLTASAQFSQTQGNSPLYSSRPYEARAPSGLPKALADVGIDQKLNEQLPLDAVFKNENGESVKLGDYFGKKPVLLSLVYYECPMLCNQVLNGMVTNFRVLAFQPGQEFEVVTVSFDNRETPALATAKKKTYIDYLPAAKREGVARGWHFLTGDAANIKRLTEAVGFRYRFDSETNQFAHGSGIFIATPQGKLARYFYGIEYAPRDVRLGLIEAAENKIGSPVDQLLLYCFHYDPATGKYGAVVMNMVQIGGILTLLAMGAMFFVMRRRVAQTVSLRRARQAQSS